MEPELIVKKMMKNDLFSQWLNIKLITTNYGESKISTIINKNMTNGFKIAHGGICYSLADSCLAFAANSKGNIALTKKSTIRYFKKVEINDQLTAHAVEDKETENSYVVNVINQNKEIVAEFKAKVHYTSTKWVN